MHPVAHLIRASHEVESDYKTVIFFLSNALPFHIIGYLPFEKFANINYYFCRRILMFDSPPLLCLYRIISNGVRYNQVI